MRIANFLLAVMFMIFAFLQINDPNPARWILIYGAMSVVCVMAMFSYYSRIVLVVLAVIFVSYSFVFLDSVREWWAHNPLGVIFGDTAKMEYPYIEETRDFLALWSCTFILVIYLVLSYRKSRRTQSIA